MLDESRPSRRRVLRTGVMTAGLTLLGEARHARAQAHELVVIANPEGDGKPLSEADLASIFTGGNKAWNNGKPIKVFNLATQTPERTTFDKAVLNKTPEQVSQYWVDKLVRGEGQPPTQVPRVELMAKVVASLPGAIGYVTPDKVDPKVKVVARIRGGKVVAP